MDLYNLHTKPHTLKHYDSAHDSVPKLILGKYGSNKAALKQREHKIAKDPAAAVQYAVSVLMDRFPEAEPNILKNARAAERYARLIINGPWKEAEDVIATDGFAAYSYASNVLKKPFPKGEAEILKDVESAHFYNEELLNGRRWPARERMLLANKKPLPIVSYAYRIIDGPWPEAEHIIAKDAQASFDYAMDVLKKRFPAGEDAINSDPHFAKLYDDYIVKREEEDSAHAYIRQLKR